MRTHQNVDSHITDATVTEARTTSGPPTASPPGLVNVAQTPSTMRRLAKAAMAPVAQREKIDGRTRIDGGCAPISRGSTSRA
jgi:hypothetical protein